MVDYQLLSIKNMFQNIKVISTGDKTTKTNKPYKSLVVQDESNAEFKVNIWSDFPDFANVKEGMGNTGTWYQKHRQSLVVAVIRLTKRQ